MYMYVYVVASSYKKFCYITLFTVAILVIVKKQ